MKAALTTPFVNSFAVTCHITTYSNSRCYHFIKTNCNCILSIHNTRINKNVPRLNGHTCGSSPFVSDTSQRDLLAPPVSWQSWLVFLSMDTHPSTNPAQRRLTTLTWHDWHYSMKPNHRLHNDKQKNLSILFRRLLKCELFHRCYDLC